MTNFNSADIRNVALVSHVGTGKTSLAEAMLFNAGQNTRLGKVDNETSLLDYEPEEIKRRTTISTSLANFDWKGKRINLLDTPGSPNFAADTISSMQGVDSIVLVIDAIDGIRIQSSKFLKQAKELGLSVVVFINKLERENANYKKVLEDIKGSFEGTPVPVQLPIGQEMSFKGIVNLIENKGYIFEHDESGKFAEVEVPADMQDDVSSTREASIESIVECDDEILEKYLEGQDLTAEDINKALRAGVVSGQVVPVLFGAATKNIGVSHLLDMITNYLPSPLEKQPVKAKTPQGQDVEIKPVENDPLAALVFKTIADPYAGQLNLMRIFSGKMASDSGVLNSSTGEKERIGQVLHLVGKKHDPATEAITGDIVAVAKLKDTHTGNTLCDERRPVTIEPVKQPSPVISFAIKPKSKGDEDKIQSGLRRLMEEDPTLVSSRDPQTKEMILSGMGQVHLDVAIEKLKRKFGVEVLLDTPKIPYKETINGSTKVQGKYKKQSGGKGQYGDCWIEIQPLERGKGFEFVDKIVGGAIPRQYIPAVENGVRGAMEEGILAGYPVVDIQVTVYDGSFHPVDSSEMAFKMAGSMAFKKAAQEAKPVLLEPIMYVEITVPEENVGDIMGDLNGRRGRMLGIDAEGHTQTVRAEIPMAEMLRYAPDLNSMTGGAGVFTMEFAHYEEVPAHIAQKIIEESKVAKEENH